MELVKSCFVFLVVTKYLGKESVFSFNCNDEIT